VTSAGENDIYAHSGTCTLLTSTYQLVGLTLNGLIIIEGTSIMFLVTIKVSTYPDQQTRAVPIRYWLKIKLTYSLNIESNLSVYAGKKISDDLFMEQTKKIIVEGLVANSTKLGRI
jgi:hypothetical protein